MTETVIGSVLGVLATLTGVFVNYYLTKRDESKKQKREQAELLKEIAIELENQKGKLNSTLNPPLLDCSAFENLRSRGYLSQLPLQLAQQIFRTYDLLARVNDDIASMRNAQNAAIASGDALRYSFDDSRKEQNEARKIALDEVKKCLEGVKNAKVR